tara:strand:- start:280 stop:489 length:210 start_codon:yes stop_codon:yes gene_type:complete
MDPFTKNQYNDNDNDNDNDIKYQLKLMTREELKYLHKAITKELYYCKCGIKLIGKYKKYDLCRKCSINK